jgi:tripartite-type tricarboxylate transporter receptor subunit TctC
MSRFFAALTATALLVLAPSARADDFPNRPITMIVPYAAGGSTDVIGRTLADRMGRELKQQVIVENVGGAGGTLGAGRVAKSAATGYTLLFHNMGHAAAPALYKALPFDPIADFEPIGLVADVPMILVGRNGLAPNTLAELIAYARANPGKLTIAHSGPGSTAQLCAMLLTSTLQTTLTNIPYRGTGPALQDMIGGQVDLICDQPVSTTSYLQSNLLKGYAVANPTRLPTLPAVPTFAEAGLPGFSLAVWHGLYAPDGHATRGHRDDRSGPSACAARPGAGAAFRRARHRAGRRRAHHAAGTASAAEVRGGSMGSVDQEVGRVRRMTHRARRTPRTKPSCTRSKTRFSKPSASS